MLEKIKRFFKTLKEDLSLAVDSIMPEDSIEYKRYAKACGIEVTESIPNEDVTCDSHDTRKDIIMGEKKYLFVESNLSTDGYEILKHEPMTYDEIRKILDPLADDDNTTARWVECCCIVTHYIR